MSKSAETFARELRAIGFEPGWGDTAGRVADTMKLLPDLLEAPSPQLTETFLARMPMLFSVLIVSPHGWLGQSGVLEEPGKPLLFAMARLDYIKNLTGLVDWYGASEALRDATNLLVVSRHVDPEMFYGLQYRPRAAALEPV